MWSDPLPEEKVRHKLIHMMIDELGYPPSLLVVEKALSQLPHLAQYDKKLPDRRVDLLAYGKKGAALVPLLLVECKAVPLNDRVVNQVLGYNHYIHAYFIAIANDDEVRTGWFDDQKREYCFIAKIPLYQELLAAL
jgi:hypothetical protein